MSAQKVPVPVVRQGRPFDGAYCVLSLFERDKGLRITAYNSEALTEAELLVPWDVVVANVGPIGPSTSMDKKRPMYDVLLSRVVLEVDADGDTKIRLHHVNTRGSTPGGDGTRGGLPLSPMKGTMKGSMSSPGFGSSMSSTLSSTLPSSTSPSRGPSRPGIDTRGNQTRAGSKTLKSPGASLTPVRRGHGAARPKSQGDGNQRGPRMARTSPARRSATTDSPTGSGAFRKTMGSPKPVAGYVPPTDLSRVPDEIVMEAKRLLHPESKDRLALFLREPPTVLGAKSLGIDLKTLRAKPLSAFKTGPGDTEAVCQLKLQHHERMRLENLSLLLAERPAAEKQLLERMEKAEEDSLRMSKGFLAAMHAERQKIAAGVTMVKKIKGAGDRENDLLAEKRAQFADRTVSLQRKHAQLDERKRQQKERLEQRAREHAAKIAEVQARREMNEQEWLAHIEAKKQEKARKQAKHKAMLGDGAQERAARNAERARMRKQKAKEAEEELEARRHAVLASMKDKEEASKAMQEKLREEMEQRKAEKWIAMQTKLANAERVRREREFRQKEARRKIEQNAARIQALEDMKAAIAEERRQVKWAEKIELDHWRHGKLFERDVTPGPGEYQSKSTLESKAGVMAREAGKSVLDEMTKRAARIPGPADYDNVTKETRKGGTMNRQVFKTTFAEHAERAAALPGVGDYETRVKEKDKGGVMTQAQGGSFMEGMARHGASLPAPGEYAPAAFPRVKPKLSELQQRFQSATTKLRAATRFMMKSDHLVAKAFQSDMTKRDGLRDALSAAAKKDASAEA